MHKIVRRTKKFVGFALAQKIAHNNRLTFRLTHTMDDMLSIEPIAAFADNYIWMLVDQNSRKAVLVDPGDAAPVLDVLQQRGITPVAIFITHHHADHTRGIHQLVTAYNMPVYAPAQEIIPCATHPVREGDSIKVDALALNFQVLDVPGHTRGHVAYYAQDMLFCGDTLFTGGCGRLFEGTAAQMYASLTKIAALPAQTLIYCAHEYTAANLNFARLVEPDNSELQQRIHATAQQRQARQATVPASLALEKQTNPFLRCHLPAIKAAAENFSGHALADGTAVFAVVRHWKDTLD
jgi:hydroxyacylglutathione hydrolase